jgi:hypothetical protein
LSISHISALDALHLVQTSNKSLFGRLKSRVQEGIHNVECESAPDDAGSHDQHVHVIMLDTLMSGVGIVANSCANSGHFVDGYTDPNSGTAD